MNVIIEDRRPNKPYAGVIVSEAERNKLATDKSVYTMPADPETMNMGALSGYYRRDYGRGITLSDSMPGMACRMALYSHARASVLHWRARIVCSDAFRREAKPAAEEPAVYVGSLRLVSDTSQGFSAGNVSVTSDTAFNFGALTDDKYDGHGWVVGGSARSRMQQDGVFGFALYGVGRGFRVVWAALTQTG